jgi:hypothetical protein
MALAERGAMRKTLPLACLLFGCSAAKMSPPIPTDLLAAPDPGTGVQLEMLGDLDPGQEIERCRFFVTPPGGLTINRETLRYTPGSHHVLLFTTDYSTIPQGSDGVDQSQVFDCPSGPAGFSVVGVIGGAQDPTPPDLALPDGVALTIPEGTVLLMNTHYLNATQEAIAADARINLYTIDPSSVKEQAGTIFFYDPYILVPALAPAAQARMVCPVPRDITLLSAQSHMHRRGIGYQADLIDPSGARTMLYQSNDWQNVMATAWAEGKQLQAGSAIDYHCDYKNGESRDVVQGLTTSDEMCMFLGVYYPRNLPFELCSTHDDFYSFSSAATFVGDGAQSCSAALDCVDAVPSLDFTGKMAACITATCEKAGPSLSKVIHCRDDQRGTTCKDACTMDGPACTACLQQACASERAVCAASSCN